MGYIPFCEGRQSNAEQLRLARMVVGKTQAEVANQLSVDESNLRLIELGLRMPFQKTREKIEKFVVESMKSKSPILNWHR